MTRATVLAVFAASLLGFCTSTDTASADPASTPPGKQGDPFSGRTKAGKKRLLEEFGGSREGEEAVMLGLAWLAQKQKKEGNWVYEGESHVAGGPPGHLHFESEHAAATGMAVLAFTGAGQSHKEGRYKQTVQAGVDWLVANIDMSPGANNGHFRTSTKMYTQGIATLALVEAYGLTRDPALRPAAQAAVDYIQRAQAPNGSWGYHSGQHGDTSIVGWQLQALHAAHLTKDLTVDTKVIQNALRFLDAVSPGKVKSTYGYNSHFGAQPATSLTAIGLLCRYYMDGWRRDTAAFADGAKGLTRRAVVSSQNVRNLDMYYYYYATQVVRFYGGEEWKTWNEGPVVPGDKDGKRAGGLADALLRLQVRTPTDRGSWDPRMDAQPFHISFGGQCGRLGTTCMCLLTLEVYYRYAPETEKGK